MFRKIKQEKQKKILGVHFTIILQNLLSRKNFRVFFKQKTAYEIASCLVGSEMCIRDSIYDNRFSGGGNSPDGLDLKALKTALYGLKGSFPDVLWDGFADKAKMVDGKLPRELNICVNNGNIAVLNADGPGGYKNPEETTPNHLCDLEKLEPIQLATSG